MSGPRVFISYRRSTSAMLANLIRTELVNHRIQTFLDDRQFTTRGPIPDMIRREIESATIVVVVLGEGTLESYGGFRNWSWPSDSARIPFHNRPVLHDPGRTRVGVSRGPPPAKRRSI